MCWYTFMMGDFKKCACLRRHLVDYVRRLNLGVNADPSLSIVQTEQRRRTFWVIYVTDAWLSFYTDARLINMAKEEWTCKKPILEDSQLQALDSRNLKWEIEQPPQILQQNETTEAVLQIPSFVELIHLASIVGDMFDYLRSPSSHRTDGGHNLESQLTDWFRHLPSYLEYGKTTDDEDNTPAPVAKTIRILYHTVQIMMHQSPLLAVDNYTRNKISREAADAIIHIAGQMLQQQDELKLYNTFTMSITLATSIHLESVMTHQSSEQSEHSRACLGRSIRVLKDANCSYLTRVDFDRLVDRFLTNRCGLTLDDGTKSSQQLAGMWQILHRSRQSLTPDQQRQVLANHPYNNNTLGSPPSFATKSTGSIEPIILSEPFLSTSSNAPQNLDIDGLLNDSMTDLIFGDGNGFDDSVPSASSWAAYVSNNHGPLFTAQTNGNAATTATVDTVMGMEHTDNCYQQNLSLQTDGRYQQTSSASSSSSQLADDMQGMDSSVSSASPSSTHHMAVSQSSDQDNRIRLLPASTLLPSIHHSIT
ncbi:hypothetical protein BCR42DRAFT_149688 [Absidia repens]|uniref:Xylanolytic transcriptional activator regulatory domain-containing protein n=1 Tax=Absidia repens TaxID=90262 RepID=A0A1X2I2J3_9FUNG|nr:hypothetical protein BCR42DRAFT_149688 [Absidia repens]